MNTPTRLVEFLGGVPHAFVPDQDGDPASAMREAARQGGVLIAEHWLLGWLRNITYFSIAEPPQRAHHRRDRHRQDVPACALAQQGCRKGNRAFDRRASRLFSEPLSQPDLW